MYLQIYKIPTKLIKKEDLKKYLKKYLKKCQEVAQVMRQEYGADPI